MSRLGTWDLRLDNVGRPMEKEAKECGENDGVEMGDKKGELGMEEGKEGKEGFGKE